MVAVSYGYTGAVKLLLDKSPKISMSVILSCLANGYGFILIKSLITRLLKRVKKLVCEIPGKLKHAGRALRVEGTRKQSSDEFTHRAITSEGHIKIEL